MRRHHVASTLIRRHIYVMRRWAIGCFPAGTQRWNDVLTSMRRHHVASTLIRRHFYVMRRWAIGCFPAGTQSWNNVLTSMRRHHVASTLIQRHFYVISCLPSTTLKRPLRKAFTSTHWTNRTNSRFISSETPSLVRKTEISSVAPKYAAAVKKEELQNEQSHL